jgi:2-polyprenyl-6-methoxyphenol hydroxylase-like FAD-dependent oxidoreductase
MSADRAGQQEIVVIGAGVGGLGAALGLARSGHRVTEDPEVAFASWDRSGVTQARQPHSFWARSRNLLQENAPEVLERLRAIGVGEWNVLDLAPPNMREPEDDQFTSLLVRRLPFELTLRQVVAAEPLVEIRPETLVDGLEFADDTNGGRPQVAGVQLRGGESLAADFVVDAGGRRTRIPGFLEERGATIPFEVQDCNQTYYGRYYRQHEHSSLNRDTLIRGGGADLGYMQYGTFLGDNHTFAMFFGPPSWDQEFKALRHSNVWEAVGGAIPAIAPWLDPDHSEALTDIQPMAGHQNVLRRFVEDGRPVALGVLPVGDALCTTNPANGWGASLALTHAFAAVDAINVGGGDLAQVASAYDEAIGEETETYLRVSAAQDRLRTYRWRGEEIPEEDREEAERQDLLANGLNPAMRRDMHVLRAMMRRATLVDGPNDIWSDEHALEVARETAAWRKENRPASVFGPPREEMLEIMAAAAEE